MRQYIRLLISLTCILILIAACHPADNGQVEEEKPTIRPFLVLYAFDAEGILLAEEMETDSAARVFGRFVGFGKLAGQEVVLAESGMGLINASMSTQRLIDLYHPKAVIFSGIAGAVDSSVQIGDIVICDSWAVHDYGIISSEGFSPWDQLSYLAHVDSVARVMHFACDSVMMQKAGTMQANEIGLNLIDDRMPKLIVGGHGVSGNQFIDNAEKRIWLGNQFGALIVDMESAAVAQICHANGLPFIAFRSASDLAGGDRTQTAEKQLEEFFEVAAENSSMVMMTFLRSLD